MSMQAHIHTDSKGDITIRLEGDITFDSIIPFKGELSSLINSYPHSVITLDLNSLDFVGSSGIGVFIQTIRELNKKHQNIFMSNIKSEFLKVFKIYDKNIGDFLKRDHDQDEIEQFSPRPYDLGQTNN